mmetsp:Transcript_105713/g.166919  ORF Transcript_105713/g.166919 Transcript_105713/m.166919 type:complete len:143 (+) Transcript_105713:53-481(+)
MASSAELLDSASPYSWAISGRACAECRPPCTCLFFVDDTASKLARTRVVLSSSYGIIMVSNGARHRVHNSSHVFLSLSAARLRIWRELDCAWYWVMDFFLPRVWQDIDCRAPNNRFLDYYMVLILVCFASSSRFMASRLAWH